MEVRFALPFLNGAHAEHVSTALKHNQTMNEAMLTIYRVNIQVHRARDVGQDGLPNHPLVIWWLRRIGFRAVPMPPEYEDDKPFGLEACAPPDPPEPQPAYEEDHFLGAYQVYVLDVDIPDVQTPMSDKTYREIREIYSFIENVVTLSQAGGAPLVYSYTNLEYAPMERHFNNLRPWLEEQGGKMTITSLWNGTGVQVKVEVSRCAQTKPVRCDA